VVKILETERLLLRQIDDEDAELLVELLNEPAFLRHIGDRGVRNTEDARKYIADGPVASYRKFGFGLYLVELKGSGESIGICGLLKRESLEDPDIGFAFLEKYWSRGYAHEAGGAVLEYGRKVLGLKRIVALTAPANDASIHVLEKLGLRYEKMVRLKGAKRDSKLFASEV
jgi:RimJ/RimL family protein N-acetyltransferase